MLRKSSKKGQSTLEYIILITAVITIVIGLVVSNKSPFKQTLNTSFNTAVQGMNAMGARWGQSMNLSN